MALSETNTRVLVAALGIPVAIGAVYLGGWVLAALTALLAVLSALEFFRLVEAKGVRPIAIPGAAVAGVFVLLAALRPQSGPEGAGFGVLVALATLVLAAAAIWARGVAGQPIVSVSTTLFGATYTGALLSFALFLRHIPGNTGAWHGTALLFAPILLTWTSDTFAYFVGRKWGTRKLIPKVSPGKTVQGALGAIVGSVAVAIGYREVLGLFPSAPLSIAEAILFGVLISVASQVGDLAESLFKRDAGVKDSGRLLPGHGGALDRFDSLFFTLPLGYFFFRFIVEHPAPF